MPNSLTLEIVHEVPGRIRARCSGLRENPALSEDIRATATYLPGLESVSIRPSTQSVVFAYSLEDTDPESFLAALRAHAQVSGPPPPVQAPDMPLGEEMIHRVKRFWAGTDRDMRRATGGTLDLRSTAPWIFVLIGLRQVALHPELPSLPWYTAFYHSLQTIFLFREEPPPSKKEGQDEAIFPDMVIEGDLE